MRRDLEKGVGGKRASPFQCHRATILRMTDNTTRRLGFATGMLVTGHPFIALITLLLNRRKPKPPVVFPSNWRNVTDEKVGTVIGIVGGDGCEGNEAGMTDTA
jgi:hypothetical protein